MLLCLIVSQEDGWGQDLLEGCLFLWFWHAGSQNAIWGSRLWYCVLSLPLLPLGSLSVYLCPCPPLFYLSVGLTDSSSRKKRRFLRPGWGHMVALQDPVGVWKFCLWSVSHRRERTGRGWGFAYAASWRRDLLSSSKPWWYFPSGWRSEMCLEFWWFATWKFCL